MKFKMGDLVHIPSGSYRVLYTKEDDGGQMHIPFSFSITQKPKVGVFKQYHGSQECVVLFSDGEYCIDTRWVFKKQGVKKNDRTYYDFANKSELVS
jgi:hypothetical protein